MNRKERYLRWLIPLLLSCLIPISYAERGADEIGGGREIAYFKNPLACKPTIQATDNRPLGSSTAAALGWVSTDDPSNLCKGYFTEPMSLIENPNPRAPDSQTTTINASAAPKLTASGESVLEGSVVLTQPGRIVKADKAYVYRDGKTGRITTIELFQHVSLEEHGRRILGSHASINFENHTILIDDVLYHFTRSQQSVNYDSWGEASKFTKESSGLIELENATYSGASPVDPAWKIKAKKIIINRAEGWGKAYHTTLKFFDTPVFYFPYYSFPTDNRRKTGFLQPIIGYSKQNGLDAAFPFYLNLAPNYDWTITPRLMTERGMQYNNLFRYLTPRSDGSIYLSYLPSDHGFQQFKNQVFSLYPDNSTYQTYLNRLNQDSNDRGFISTKNNYVFNENWKSNLLINYVSDDYYFEDFGSSGGFGAANSGTFMSSQLLNQYDLEYSGEHWNFTSLVQAYETLHPINQSANNDQYRRLPEFDLNGSYPSQWHGLGFSLESQAVNFGYQSDFTPNQPIGQRFHARPGINLPMNWAAAYITPEVLWDTTAYLVQQPQPGQADSSLRNIPLIDVDSGLYLDRQFNFGAHSYTQTLEPEVFYLYVPYQSQSQIPVYDTQLQPFTVNQLFVTNAFTGFDRIQNANQVSVGLTSRLLDSATSAQKLSASLGMIAYFEKPQVCLNSSCIPSENNLSPIVGQLSYNPFAQVNATANIAWDPNLRQTNNSGLSLNYNGERNKTATLAYQFVHGTPGATNTSNTNLVQTGGSWPLSYHWSGLGYINYNIGQSYTQNAYGGLEYDNCGWALRLVASRNFVGTQPNGNQYDTAYYFQLQLTGLGNIGTGRPDALLSTLPGYRNSFN